jgi:hypothetical protein
MRSWEISTGFWSETLKSKDHLEELGIDGRKIFKWISNTYFKRVWIGFVCLE